MILKSMSRNTLWPTNMATTNHLTNFHHPAPMLLITHTWF